MTNLNEIGGKAVNLKILRVIAGINVPCFVVLPASFSEAECEEVVKSFLSEHGVSEVAVRSSATKEDSEEASFAGMYLTKLQVPADLKAIMAAVKEVRQSNKLKEETAANYAKELQLQSFNPEVGVIVQKMILPEISGVIFSHSLMVRDGYYSISVTDGLGEAVVSGLENGKLIKVARAIKSERIKEAWLADLISAMRIVERHYESDSLDVEFAYKDNSLYILQCRPITTRPVMLVGPEEEAGLIKQLDSISKDVSISFGGDLFGDMIDINPSELLGDNPSKLDISIFRVLFADTIVEQVRRDMGYNPLGFGLIRVIGGKPYVSLRASAFSFRPKGISDSIYAKMLEVYRKALMDNPALQSRVEFAVYAMSSGKKLERIMEDGRLTEDEKAVVHNAFEKLDKSFIGISQGCLSVFEQQAAEYLHVTKTLHSSSLEEMLAHVALGTKLFVRVARLAFYWKNRFEEIYPQEELNELIAGHIQSVSSRLESDLRLYAEDKITREKLVERYGHLRPGQFSIFGESYADDPDHYLFSVSRMTGQATNKRKHEFEDVMEFKNVVSFMQAREEMKFLFSQSLGIFIEKLKSALRNQGIAEEQAGQFTWEELQNSLENKSLLFREQEYIPMILPEVLIPGASDLGVVIFPKAMPSYITKSIVKACVCVLDAPDQQVDVRDSIVLIPNADPGYDFLFHSGIAGIITKTGGPASHMCIRAIELQIPACIGCGDSTYDMLSRAQIAVLDCMSKQVIVSR